MSGGMIVIDAGGFADVVMNTKGDMVDFDTSRQRLAIGNANDILTVSSDLPVWSAPAVPSNVQYSVAAMAGVDFNFSSTDAVQTLSIAGTTTFTGSNYAAGKSITLFLTTDASERDLAFPAGWKFQGTMPTSQAASKIGTLTVMCAGTTEASVRCAYAVEE